MCSVVRYIRDIIRDANTNICLLTVAFFMCKTGLMKQETMIRSRNGNKEDWYP